MLRATMTILGLYTANPDLFSGMILPAGVNREVIINNLLMELGGIEILYPDPDFMRFAIQNWSMARIDSWERMFEALSAEYNPLYNYDRTEISEVSGNGESTTKTPVYDEGTLVDTANTNSNSTTNGNVRVYGNIGVTTSTQMLDSEIKMRSSTDFDSLIIGEFKERFCILVY